MVPENVSDLAKTYVANCVLLMTLDGLIILWMHSRIGKSHASESNLSTGLDPTFFSWNQIFDLIVR